MKTFHNPEHTRHVGQHEMFRGKLVPCHEVPARLDHVLAELERREGLSGLEEFALRKVQQREGEGS